MLYSSSFLEVAHLFCGYAYSHVCEMLTMPRPLNRKKAASSIRSLAVRRLVDVLRNGRPLIDPSTGRPVVDEAGQVVTTPASAADLNAAHRWYAALIGEAERAADDDELANEIAAMAAKANLRLAGAAHG